MPTKEVIKKMSNWICLTILFVVLIPTVKASTEIDGSQFWSINLKSNFDPYMPTSPEFKIKNIWDFFNNFWEPLQMYFPRGLITVAVIYVLLLGTLVFILRRRNENDVKSYISFFHKAGYKGDLVFELFEDKEPSLCQSYFSPHLSKNLAENELILADGKSQALCWQEEVKIGVQDPERRFERQNAQRFIVGKRFSFDADKNFLVLSFWSQKLNNIDVIANYWLYDIQERFNVIKKETDLPFRLSASTASIFTSFSFTLSDFIIFEFLLIAALTMLVYFVSKCHRIVPNPNENFDLFSPAYHLNRLKTLLTGGPEKLSFFLGCCSLTLGSCIVALIAFYGKDVFYFPLFLHFTAILASLLFALILCSFTRIAPPSRYILLYLLFQTILLDCVIIIGLQALVVCLGSSINEKLVIHVREVTFLLLGAFSSAVAMYRTKKWEDRKIEDAWKPFIFVFVQISFLAIASSVSPLESSMTLIDAILFLRQLLEVLWL